MIYRIKICNKDYTVISDQKLSIKKVFEELNQIFKNA